MGEAAEVCSSGEELGVDGVEGLLVDKTSGALILEAAVHLLDLCVSEPCGLAEARDIVRPVSLWKL